MIAIWPAGPPKLMQPSLNQYRNASLRVGVAGAAELGALAAASTLAVAVFVIAAAFVVVESLIAEHGATSRMSDQPFQQLHVDQIADGAVTGVGR